MIRSRIFDAILDVYQHFLVSMAIYCLTPVTIRCELLFYHLYIRNKALVVRNVLFIMAGMRDCFLRRTVVLNCFI